MENSPPNYPPQQASQAKTQQPQLMAPQQGSLVYECDWFPMTTSPWIASIAFVPLLFLAIHHCDFYADLAGRVFAATDTFPIISGFITDGMESIAYVFCTLLSILSLLALIWSRADGEQGYKYLLTWMGSKIFPFLRYIIDINVAIAAIFMVKAPLVPIFFTLAAVINILISFLCQNYTLRKDYLCCKSMQYMMLWRISIIVSYAINCAGYYFISSPTSFLIFLIFQFILNMCLYIFYFIFGYLMYRHSSSQIAYLFLLNLFCALSFAQLYDCFLTMTTDTFVPNRSLVTTGFFFVFLVLLSYSLWTSIKKKGSLIDSKDPIKKIFFLFNKLQNSSESINDDCQIRGIIRYHLSHSCKNQNCFVNQGEQSYFDSKKNKYCFPNKLNQGKTSFVKFLAKCIYQQELDNTKWQNTDLLLDYIEFYYLKLKNLFRVSILLVELEKKFLTPFQKIRVCRLRRVMVQQNRKINQQLYNGGLDLQNLISSETKFDEIQQQMKELQTKNIEWWKYIENYSINLSVMVKMLRPSFALIEKINSNWKHIAKYFEVQRVWKFMFACYTLYFRNQKLKPQLLQQFGQSVHEEQLFTIESIHIDKTTEPGKLTSSKIIFEQDVCCIHINHSQQKPIIKAVSRYFQRIFEYQNIEVIESSLDILMTPSFRAFHRSKFLKWVGEGKSNKESNYEVKKVFPINKSGYIVSSFKFYKQFLCLNNQLQYVGMIKKNKQQQLMMILNSNYEIEGMTESLAVKLGLGYKQYQEVIGLNVLIMIPDLIKYTKFEEEKGSVGQGMLGQFQKINKNTLTCEFSQKSKSKKQVICSNKQFNKSNLLLNLPCDIDAVKLAYLPHNERLKSSVLTRICRAHRLLNEKEGTKKYKVEIEIRLIDCQQNSSYLELYFRQLQSTERVETKKNTCISIMDQKSLQSYHEQLQQEDLNKFFENSHGSQNISLAPTDNIFIKEDNNQPVDMIYYVKEITLYVRIIFFLFVVFLVASLLFQFTNYANYEQNSLKTKSMVKIQLELFMLNSKLNSEVLGIPGDSHTVVSLTESLRQVRENSIEFKKSILDSKINHNQMYEFFDGEKVYSYDQIDIFDKAFENIFEIYYDFKKNSIVDSHTLRSLSGLLFPSMEKLTTDAIAHISAIFDEVYRTIEIKNYIYLSAGILLLALGFVLILFRLIKIAKSFVNLIQIFTQFSETDLKKIVRYCVSVQQLFGHLSKKYEMFREKEEQTKAQSFGHSNFNNRSSSNGSHSFKGMSSLNPDAVINEDAHEQDNANLNKKVKKVVIGKELTNLKIKSIVFVVVFLFLYGMTSLGLSMYTSIINKQIIEYKSTGNEIFQYYSAINIEYISMKERAIKREAFNYEPYRLYADRLDKMKTLIYQQGSGLYSDFMAIRNGIIFGNVCQINEMLSASGFSLAQCLSISENNLKHGIQSFLLFMNSNVDYFKVSSSYTLDMTLMSDIEMGMSICNACLEYLLEKWSQHFVSLMWTLKRNIIIICSGLFLLQVIIYIILVEVLTVGNLEQKFLFFRKVYNHMMPDFIVTKEKIIKAKLQVEGFIKK